MTPAELTAHYAKLIEDVFQHVISGNEAAAADILAAHDREIVALADASQAAAVALARESRAAEISAGLRERAPNVSLDWCDMRGSCAAALISVADDIDAGRI